MNGFSGFRCRFVVAVLIVAVHAQANANPCDGPIGDLLTSFNSGNYEKTVEIATEIMIDPDRSACPSLHTTRGRAFLLLGQTDEAVRDFENGVRLSPADCDGNIFLVIGYRKQGRTDIPDAGLRSCLALEPNNIDAQFMLAAAYMNNGAYDAAADAFEVLSKRAPDELDARLGRAWALRKSSRYTEAKSVLEEALASHPDLPLVHDELGQLYFAQGEYRQSIDSLSDAIRLSSSSEGEAELVAASHNSRALAWLALGSTDEAERDTDSSIALFETASAYLTRAKIAFRKGDPDRACLSLEKAKTLDPDREDADEIGSLLSRCR